MGRGEGGGAREGGKERASVRKVKLSQTSSRRRSAKVERKTTLFGRPVVLVVGCEARVRARSRAKGSRRERRTRAHTYTHTRSCTCVVAIQNGEREGKQEGRRHEGRKEGRKEGKEREERSQCVSVLNSAFR